MSDNKVRELKATGAIDEDAAELAAHFRALAKRAEAGEVIGIYAVLVTDDPKADDIMEGVEEFIEGLVYTEEKVIVALEEIRREMIEDLLDAADD